MTLEERKVFWDTLCSFEGSEPTAEMERLKATIKYPKYLFRYRSVSINNLEALRTNRLYFSSANYYDDPFDTFLHIDIDRAERELRREFSDPENLKRIAESAKAFAEKHDKFFPQDVVCLMTDPQSMQKLFFGGVGADFLAHLMRLRNKVREDTWSVCFSKNGINETLWLKYADQYKGFSLIYDLENEYNLLCGKQEKCKSCCFHDRIPSRYPLHYSNTLYDATNFTRTVLLHTAMKESDMPALSEMLSEMGPAIGNERRLR